MIPDPDYLFSSFLPLSLMSWWKMSDKVATAGRGFISIARTLNGYGFPSPNYVKKSTRE